MQKRNSAIIQRLVREIEDRRELISTLHPEKDFVQVSKHQRMLIVLEKKYSQGIVPNAHFFGNLLTVCQLWKVNLFGSMLYSSFSCRYGSSFFSCSMKLSFRTGCFWHSLGCSVERKRTIITTAVHCIWFDGRLIYSRRGCCHHLDNLGLYMCSN